MATTPSVKTVVNDVKAGYRTSEFYLHLAVQLATWVEAYSTNSNAVRIASVALSVLSLFGYVGSRTVVKSMAGAGTTTTQLTSLGKDVQAVEGAVVDAVKTVTAPQS